MHEMLAAMTKLPELRISEPESKRLGEAAANVAKHYDIGADAKTIAWTQLGFCCVMIYGSRIYDISDRRSREKEQRRQALHQQQAETEQGQTVVG